MTIQDAYNAWAPTYDSDRNLTRDLDAEITRRLLRARRLSALLEAGCGTGKNTAFYSTIASSVLAFDFSDEMLDIARGRSLASHVRLVRHDLREPWPAAASNADLVAFNLVLEHFEELRPIFDQASLACRPGGTLFLSELHPFKQYRGSQARFRVTEGTEVRVPAFVHHISDFVQEAEKAGFRLENLGEWRHELDEETFPRLLTLRFRKE